jgi:hypothetical protein
MSEILEQLKAALAGRYTIEREIGYGGMADLLERLSNLAVRPEDQKPLVE